jgi:hypothetical protein
MMVMDSNWKRKIERGEMRRKSFERKKKSVFICEEACWGILALN